MKYSVEFCYTVYDSVEVEAANEEDAEAQVEEMIICKEIGGDHECEDFVITDVKEED